MRTPPAVADSQSRASRAAFPTMGACHIARLAASSRSSGATMPDGHAPSKSADGAWFEAKRTIRHVYARKGGTFRPVRRRFDADISCSARQMTSGCGPRHSTLYGSLPRPDSGPLRFVDRRVGNADRTTLLVGVGRRQVRKTDRRVGPDRLDHLDPLRRTRDAKRLVAKDVPRRAAPADNRVAGSR